MYDKGERRYEKGHTSMPSTRVREAQSRTYSGGGILEGIGKHILRWRGKESENEEDETRPLMVGRGGLNIDKGTRVR